MIQSLIVTCVSTRGFRDRIPYEQDTSVIAMTAQAHTLTLGTTSSTIEVWQ